MQGEKDSWKKKMHPLFVETARVYYDEVKELKALGPNPKAEDTAKVHSRLRKKLGKILIRYPNPDYTPSALDPLEVILSDWQPSVWPPSESETEFGQSEVLYWQRFREPMKIAVLKRNAGDLKAFRRIVRIDADRFVLQFGKGPIKPFKTDDDHDVLFGLGLDLGLSELTENELADCFDAICPCGKKQHDPDSLKHQRLLKYDELKRIREWLASEGMNLMVCQPMAVYGANEVYAKAVLNPLGNRRVYIGEIGKAPVCYVDEYGNAFGISDSKLTAADAEELARGFTLTTSDELFSMFFPPATKTPRATSRNR